MIINKYRTIKVEMMLRQKDDENRAKNILQKTFRSSMSREIRTPHYSTFFQSVIQNGIYIAYNNKQKIFFGLFNILIVYIFNNIK